MNRKVGKGTVERDMVPSAQSHDSEKISIY